MLAYPIRFRADGDTVLVTAPDFPELTTFGVDESDAFLHARDALEEAIAARMAARQEVPPPSRGRRHVALTTQASLKILLYREMRCRGISKAQLARRLSWHPPQVDRLLNLNHASRLDQVDAAFAALGARIEVAVTEAA